MEWKDSPTLDGLNDLDERARQVFREASTMSVFCQSHPLEPVRPTLARSGFVTAHDLRRVNSGQIVVVTGLLVIVHTPQRSRAGGDVHYGRR